MLDRIAVSIAGFFDALAFALDAWAEDLQMRPDRFWSDGYQVGWEDAIAVRGCDHE